MKSFTFLTLATIAAATVLVAAAVGPLAEPMAEPAFPSEQPATESALACDTPAVAAFQEIRMQALELSELAGAAPAPLEDTPEARQRGDEALADLSQRARMLDALIAQAAQPGAPLTAKEQRLAQGVSVHTARLVNLASRMQAATAEQGEFDAAFVVGGLDSMSVQGWELAQLIADASLCDSSLTLSETAPYEVAHACDAMDPEYEIAMHGVCSY